MDAQPPAQPSEQPPAPIPGQRLAPALVRKAVEIYLAEAYPATGGAATSGAAAGGARVATAAPLPAAVRKRVEALQSASEEEFYQCPTFERDAAQPPTRFAVRLGNPFYPHMKMMLECSPDGRRFLLRVDTHDRHACPLPASKEYPLFCQLMERNQRLASAIEAQWAEQGLPTFKTYLRDDLARRKAEASAPGGRPNPGPAGRNE